MVDHWFGINSTHLDSHCGHSGVDALEGALNGTGSWGHLVREEHWFILDLGQTYTIKKLRGRSNDSYDPKKVDAYVSDSKVDWGAAVATDISTWQDTNEWAEVNTTVKDGRYIKIVVTSTEAAPTTFLWGDLDSPFIIFDAYGDVAVPLNLCTWLGDHGAPLGITVSDIYEIGGAYSSNIPPTGYTFVPTVVNVCGVADYYLGFNGDPATGCNFYP